MSEQKLYGVLAEFDSAHDIYHACEKVRDAGYTRWDAHTPFPVDRKSTRLNSSH